MMHPRQARAWHRRIAAVAIALVAWFAASGLVLNHAADLRLHERALPPSLAALFYDNALPAHLLARRVDTTDYVVLDNTLWRVASTARAVGPCTALVGATALGALHAVACTDVVYVLDADGALVEHLDTAWGITAPVAAIDAASDDTLRVATPIATWCVDADITRATRCEATVSTGTPTEAGAATRATLARALGAPAIDVERFVHDLHSGRLFGAAARFAWDLFALALLLLAVSGARLLWRRGGT